MFKVYKMCMFPLFLYSACHLSEKFHKICHLFIMWSEESYPEELKSKLGYMMGQLFLILGSVPANHH